MKMRILNLCLSLITSYHFITLGQVNKVSEFLGVNNFVIDNNENIYIIKNDSVFKYSPFGKKTWCKKANIQFTTIPVIAFNGIKLNNANELILSGYDYTSGEGFLIKYNWLGDTVWSLRNIKGSPNIIKVNSSGKIFFNTNNGLIIADNNGNLLVLDTNNYYNAMDFNNNYYRAYVTSGTYYIKKYDSTRTLQWIYQFGGINYVNEAVGLETFDAQDNVYSYGWMLGYCGGDQDYFGLKVNSSGGQQWTACYNGLGNYVDKSYGMAVDKNGGICLTGESCPPACGGANTNQNMVTVKFNPSGSQQWIAIHSNPGGYAIGYAAAVDDSGYVYAGGNESNVGMILLKFNQSGNVLWSKKEFNGSLIRNIIFDKYLNIYVYGFGTLIKYCQYPPVSSFSIDTVPLVSGKTVYFSNNSLNYSRFIWDYGNGKTDSTNMNGIMEYDSAGIYLVTLIASNACGADTFQQIIEIIKGCNYLQPGFLASMDTVLEKDTVLFTDTSTGSSSWFWIFGDGYVDSIKNPKHAYNVAGNYLVGLQVKNADSSCVKWAFSPIVVMNSAGIWEKLTSTFFNAYPNPSYDEVFCVFALPYSSFYQLRLCNPLGETKMIISENFTEAYNINHVNFLPSIRNGGIYFLVLSSEKNTFILRMVILDK